VPNEQFFSQKQISSIASDYNAMVFTISQLINKIDTMSLVRVTKVTNAGGVSPVGYINAQLLVNQLTVNDNRRIKQRCKIWPNNIKMRITNKAAKFIDNGYRHFAILVFWYDNQSININQ